MMYYASPRYLHFPPILKVGRHWLEKVERLGGNRVVQLLSMLCKIPPNSDYAPASAHKVGHHRWG